MKHSNSEYTIEHILDVIFAWYTAELKWNTSRLLANVLTSFWLTLPSTDTIKRTDAEKVAKCYSEIYEVMNILSSKFQLGEIIITKNWSLQWGSNNIINHENLDLEVGTMIAWNVSLNQSIWNKTIIDSGCFLKDVALVDSQLEEWVIIEWWMYSKIVQSKIDLGTVLFGWAKIRESKIWERNEIGQLEAVRSATWNQVKALHWAYIWDACIWDNVNISNFFGITNSSPAWKKSKVTIWDNVFLWWHATIVSGDEWIIIWNNAIVWAWATVLCNIPEWYTYITKDKIYPNKK